MRLESPELMAAMLALAEALPQIKLANIIQIKEGQAIENYNEILKDIEQLKFDLEAYEDLVPEEMIEAMNFSLVSEERVSTGAISDKTCKIALIYSEVSKRMNNEAKEEIRKMIVASEYEIRKLDYCIARLDPKIREVIKGVYIDKMAWLVISKNLYISENTISKYKRKGIDEITQMYEIGRIVM